MKSSLVAICIALSGCATAPFNGTHASGERLDVVTEKGPSSKSRPIPLYRDAEKWNPMQGKSDIDEAAFYRIAGQPEVAQQIIDRRAGWVSDGKLGGWLFGAGVAMVAGGGGTLIGVGVMESQHWRPTTPTLTISSLIVTGVGLLGAIVGGTMIWTANDHLQDHVLTYEQAVDAANQYNAKIDANH